jgi:hypothetical protein
VGEKGVRFVKVRLWSLGVLNRYKLPVDWMEVYT